MLATAVAVAVTVAASATNVFCVYFFIDFAILIWLVHYGGTWESHFVPLRHIEHEIAFSGRKNLDRFLDYLDYLGADLLLQKLLNETEQQQFETNKKTWSEIGFGRCAWPSSQRTHRR